MASVNFAKMKGAGHAKAIMRHCDAEERLEHEHENSDIIKTRTGQNTAIKGLTYSQVCALYDRRIEELDSKPGANKRKDRVTYVGLNIPMPENLSEDQEDLWAERVWDIVAEQYGEQNLLEGWLHRDEIHEYIDPDTKERKISRAHLHIGAIPEVNGKLLAKEFTSRASMIKLNNAIHEMSVREFGVMFMDGSKKKSRGKVEDLKARSEAERIIDEAEIKAGMIIETAKYNSKTLMDMAAETSQEARIRLSKALEAEKRVELQVKAEKALSDENKARKRALDDRELSLDERERMIDGKEALIERGRRAMVEDAARLSPSRGADSTQFSGPTY